MLIQSRTITSPSQLASGSSTLECETRKATVVFVNASGKDLDVAKTASVLYPFLCRHSEIYDGAVIRVLHDDKGLVALLLFGVPPSSMEGAAGRALQFCTSAHSELASRGIQVSFGVASGNLYRGFVGSESRREMTVMGDCVNISSRLMSNPLWKGVSCDAATASACRKIEGLTISLLGSVELKGKKNSCDVFSVAKDDLTTPPGRSSKKRRPSSRSSVASAASHDSATRGMSNRRSNEKVLSASGPSPGSRRRNSITRKPPVNLRRLSVESGTLRKAITTNGDASSSKYAVLERTYSVDSQDTDIALGELSAVIEASEPSESPGSQRTTSSQARNAGKPRDPQKKGGDTTSALTPPLPKVPSFADLDRPLIGLQADRAALLRILGQHTSCLLLGDAGTGKSVLAKEVLESISCPHCVIKYAAPGTRTAQSTPYSIWASVFSQLLLPPDSHDVDVDEKEKEKEPSLETGNDTNAADADDRWKAFLRDCLSSDPDLLGLLPSVGQALGITFPVFTKAELKRNRLEARVKFSVQSEKNKLERASIPNSAPSEPLTSTALSQATSQHAQGPDSDAASVDMTSHPSLVNTSEANRVAGSAHVVAPNPSHMANTTSKAPVVPSLPSDVGTTTSGTHFSRHREELSARGQRSTQSVHEQSQGSPTSALLSQSGAPDLSQSRPAPVRHISGAESVHSRGSRHSGASRSHAPSRLTAKSGRTATTATSHGSKDSHGGHDDATKNILRRVLQACCSEQELLLVLEDAHWIDESSWNLILSCIRLIPQITFLVIARPELRQMRQFPMLQSLGEQAQIEIHEISELAKVDFEALVADLLGIPHVPQILIEALLKRSQKNTYFALEILSLFEREHVFKVVGESVVIPDPSLFETLEVPESIADLVQSRIDALTSNEKVVLKILSVINHPATIPMIETVVSCLEDALLTRDDIEESVVSLRQLGIIVSDGDHSVTISDDLVRSTAYGLLPRAQLRAFHSAYANFMETHIDNLIAEQGPMRIFSSMIHHHYRAGHISRCVDYLIKAGNQTLAIHSYHSSCDLFRAILSIENQLFLHQKKNESDLQVMDAILCCQYGIGFDDWTLEFEDRESPPTLTRCKRAFVHRKLAEIYLALRDESLSWFHLRQSLVLLEYDFPDSPGKLWFSIVSRSFTLHRKVSEMWKSVFLHSASELGTRPWDPDEHNLELISSDLGQAVDRPTEETIEEDNLDSHEYQLLRSLSKLFEYYFDHGMPYKGICAALEGIDLAKQNGDRGHQHLAENYAHLALVLSQQGHHNWAGLCGSQARSLMGKPELITYKGQGYILLMLAMFDLANGRWEEATIGFETIADISDRTNDLSGIEESKASLGFIHCLTADFVVASHLYGTVEESGRARLDYFAESWGMYGRALCDALCGSYNIALEQLSERRMLLDSVDVYHVGSEINASALLAFCLIREGKPEEARLEILDYVLPALGEMPRLSLGALVALWLSCEVLLSYLEYTQHKPRRVAVNSSSFHISRRKSTKVIHFDESACTIILGFLRQLEARLVEFTKAFPIARPKLSYVQSRIQWQMGDHYRAVRCMKESLRSAKTLDMPWDEALAHFYLGQWRSSPDYLDHCFCARRLFKRIGEAFYADQLDRLLRNVANDVTSVPQELQRE
eukprot:TRINITY_DN725_c0_g1_i7.p1 TRINITY_DN725_c0_g1~~TRINITY_DN725_c0_g1_i7.p1  ORF type:complete len:1644 (-),score=141.92 TRINITY_DN725_c0_g1_i7:69-5000(-)